MHQIYHSETNIQKNLWRAPPQTLSLWGWDTPSPHPTHSAPMAPQPSRLRRSGPHFQIASDARASIQ